MSVRDEGKGIDAEDLPKIFDYFTAVKSQGTEGEKSYGLGLNIVKQVVENHGGSVQVVSKPGIGSTFIVLLPTEYTGRSNPLSSSFQGCRLIREWGISARQQIHLLRLQDCVQVHCINCRLWHHHNRCGCRVLRRYISSPFPARQQSIHAIRICAGKQQAGKPGTICIGRAAKRNVNAGAAVIHFFAHVQRQAAIALYQ